MTSEARFRSLADWVESCREEERARIARELHDDLGQQLTAIHMDLGWLLPRLADASPDVRERLLAMYGLVDEMVETVRHIVTELRPRILDDLGLGAAVEWLAGEFERRSGIRTTIRVSDELAQLDRTRATAMFRMVQEGLTNVARHANASAVTGRIAVHGDIVELDLRDDGRGIRPEEIRNPCSLGLLNMRERAAMHGGTFRIRPLPGGGTQIRVRLPA